MTNDFDIAVIGTGFAGTALAVHLARDMRSGTRVLLLGAPGETARGLAYSTRTPEHLLNVRAGRMSLIRDDPDHFVRWLLRRTGSVIAGDPAQHYAQRMVYGEYVEDTLRQAIADRPGAITIVEEKAVQLARGSDRFAVRVAGGTLFRTRAAVLCIGHGPLSFPLPPGAIPQEAGERMIADPWTDPRMAAIASDARILFIGTSQTMADQAVGLDATDHRGSMVAVSRHGQVPATQLVRQSEPVAVPPDGRSLVHLTRSIVGAGRAEARVGRDWRAVIDGLRPHSQVLWEGFSPAERRAFIRHAEPLWLIHRSRLAPAVGEKIAALRAAGRLAVRAARLEAVLAARGGIVARLRPRGKSRIEAETFDWIINCSGVGRLRPDAMEPLLAQMLDDGLVRRHALGRGLDIKGDLTAVDSAGRPINGLSVLGPLAGGHYFETSAVPEVAEHAARLARRLSDAAVGIDATVLPNLS